MPLTRVKKVPTANLVQGSSFLTTVAMANITDFSTGTFSPTFYIGSTNNTDSSSGYYTKIGKLVHVETGHGKREKQKILENIDKDGYFKDSKLKSELILLKNLKEFPFKLLELFEW